MRNKIKYNLVYREEGDEKEKELEIDFISNRVLKDFSALIVLATEAGDAFNRSSDITTIIAGEDLTDEKILEYREEEEKCMDKILEFNSNGYFEKRFKILERVLIDNGYKEDEKLMNIDFWENCVDPSHLLEFMSSAIYKDISNKKKQHKK